MTDSSTGARIYHFPGRGGWEADWMTCPCCGEDVQLGDACVFCDWDPEDEEDDLELHW